MLSGTLGQLLINDALPEDIRDYRMVLDKKGAKAKLRELAEKYPEKYREVTHAWSNLGRRVSQDTGGYSFGMQHLRKSMAARKIQQKIRNRLKQIVDDDTIDDKTRRELITKFATGEMRGMQEAVFDEAMKAKNPLAYQVAGIGRGSKMSLSSLIGGDTMYVDHRDRPIPFPVLRSYSEGLSPEEYWAGAYGARKGVVATKMATQDAGFLGKQLNQISHRLVVTDRDYDDENQRAIMRGVPVDTDDPDNEGALLARDTGPYKKNTALTPKIIQHLNRLGNKRILVRSPMVGGSPEGGVYSNDVGVHEGGRLPGRGTQVGLMAAQALSEPISQGQLSTKHSGGVAGAGPTLSGFEAINQLVQVPKQFKGGASHSHVDGRVQSIEDAPAGGKFVTIGNERHYVKQGFNVNVKKGQEIEAGDVLSDGMPNPSEIVKYKGVGEGRRYFTKAMRQAMNDAGMQNHRKNIELLSRGLINHVRLTEEHGDHVPDDVLPYSTLEHTWQPREGHAVVQPDKAVGQYLEAPVLHYTIGTRIRPSMLQDFKDFGIKNLTVHKNPPPFEPEMIRGMAAMRHDPDWVTRMYGSNLKSGLLESAQRGGKSEERGTSFVPSLIKAVDFGRNPDAVVKPPEPGYDPSINLFGEPDDEPDPTPASQPPVVTKPKTGLFSGIFS